MKRIPLGSSGVLAALVCALVAGCSGAAPKAKASGGASCSSHTDCASGLCLGKTCCSQASCGSDQFCAGTSCDGAGACVYPSGACGGKICLSDQLTTGVCAQGDCLTSTVACPDHLACSSQGGCWDRCFQTTECTSGFHCSNGFCLGPGPAGAECMHDQECLTGICGTGDIGALHCCAQPCPTGDAGIDQICRAPDCDTTGACAYPGTGTPCLTPSCTGHEKTEPATCSGAGACVTPTPATVDCAPYACDPNSGVCQTSCSSAADCWDAFCVSASATCCSFYPGGIIHVDGTLGVDQLCCGSGTGATACATIAYAATLATLSGVMPTKLAVANPPNGKDWVADQFPITLGQGLILIAPGLYFSASTHDGGSPTLFSVTNSPAVVNPVATVIEGAPGAPIHVAFDSQWNASQGIIGIDVSGAALNLLDAEIRSSPLRGRGNETAINVTAGTLTLGSDGMGANGTVWIGHPDAGLGHSGIACGAGAHVTDQGSATAPSLWVQNIDFAIGVADGCVLNLTSSPRFGIALNDAGTCDSHPAREQVSLDGLQPDAVIDNATFECSNGGGLDVTGPFHGDRDLFLFNSIGIGLSAYSISDAGTRLTNSTFHHNDLGIYAVGPVDLSRGNEISCNDGSGIYLGAPPFGVWVGLELQVQTPSSVEKNVNAEQIKWDHFDPIANHTRAWQCSGTDDAGPCTCIGDSSCPQGAQPLPVRADILWFGQAQDSVYIDDLNGMVAPNGCP